MSSKQQHAGLLLFNEEPLNDKVPLQRSCSRAGPALRCPKCLMIYCRDLTAFLQAWQLMFDSVDTANDCIRIATGVLSTIKNKSKEDAGWPLARHACHRLGRVPGQKRYATFPKPTYAHKPSQLTCVHGISYGYWQTIGCGCNSAPVASAHHRCTAYNHTYLQVCHSERRTTSAELQ